MLSEAAFKGLVVPLPSTYCCRFIGTLYGNGSFPMPGDRIKDMRLRKPENKRLFERFLRLTFRKSTMDHVDPTERQYVMNEINIQLANRSNNPKVVTASTSLYGPNQLV